MIHALVQVTVADFERFWSGFQTPGGRSASGTARSELGSFAMRTTPIGLPSCSGGRAGRIFERFVQDPEVRASITQGGTIGAPAITYLEQAGELEA